MRFNVRSERVKEQGTCPALHEHDVHDDKDDMPDLKEIGYDDMVWIHLG
jgi:hypothetical protein